MNAAKDVTAHFVKTWVLTTHVLPGAAATAGCTVSGAGTFDDTTATPVQMTAVAGWRVDVWSGAATDTSTTTNPDTITMDADKDLTGNFVKTWVLTIDSVPGGAGIVTGGGTYDDLVAAPISATANPGYAWNNWTGDKTGVVTPTTITMDANKTVHANFIGTLVVNAGPDKLIRLGNCTVLEGAVSGGVPPYIYPWSPTGGLDIPTISQPTCCVDIDHDLHPDGDGQPRCRRTTTGSDTVTVYVGPAVTADAGSGPHHRRGLDLHAPGLGRRRGG